MKKSISFTVLLGVIVSFLVLILFNMVWRQVNGVPDPDPDLMNQKEVLKAACRSKMQPNVKKDIFSFEDLNHFSLGKMYF